jgi:uncharacterized caspase-like protein
VYEDAERGVLEPIDLEQFAPYYQEPGLLRKLWMGEEMQPVPSLSEVLLYPRVEQFKLEDGILTFALVDQGGGIGKCRVLIDGLQVRELPPAPRHSVDLTPELRDRPTAIVEVVAFDAKNFLPSRPKSDIALRIPESVLGPPGKVFAVIGGIEKYAGERLNLNFAADDAVAMAKAMLACAEGLKVEAKVWLLCADPAAKSLPADKVILMDPSKPNFETAFKDAAEAAGEQDLYFVFLSGHGTAVGTPPKYLFLTAEAREGTPDYFAPPEVQKQQAVSGDEIVTWLGEKNLKANKRVLILDTCSAAAAEGAFAEFKSDDTNQARALASFNSRTGFHALLGSPADLYSYEAPAFGHGLLTASLLRAMKSQPLGSAASPNAVLVDRLFQYARDETPRLAESIGSRQQPMVIGGDSFPLGFLTDDLRERGPATEPAPVFVRPVLFNPDEGGDTLKLGDAVSDSLNEMTVARGVQGAGSKPFAVFVDRPALKDAYKLQGSYTVSGAKVTLRLFLWQNDKRLDPPLPVIETTREKAAEDVLAALRKWLEANAPRTGPGSALFGLMWPSNGRAASPRSTEGAGSQLLRIGGHRRII